MILALDFDGVMHPRVTKDEPVFCRLDLLEAWLRQHPDVEVVISSSWREQHPFDEMQSYFADDLQHRIVGVTPIADRVLGYRWQRSTEDAMVSMYERQYEIERWIAENRPGSPWVALDDDPRLFSPDCPNLVKVDYRHGIKPGNMFTLTHTVQRLTPTTSEG